jgi:hypothetical protein
LALITELSFPRKNILKNYILKKRDRTAFSVYSQRRKNNRGNALDRTPIPGLFAAPLIYESGDNYRENGGYCLSPLSDGVGGVPVPDLL